MLIRQLIRALNPATLENYSKVQNMARFYAYDLSRHCATSRDWDFPENGLYECVDLKPYFTDKDRGAFLVQVGHELAGFALIKKEENAWDMGEFFVIAKYQGKGIAGQVATQIWQNFLGKWQIRVIPENIPALKFWRKAVSEFTGGNYIEEIRNVTYDKRQPNRYYLIFESK